MKKNRLIFLIISAALIGACSTPRQSAPIVDRTPSAKPAEVAAPVASITPSSSSVVPKAAERSPFYTVKRGDTLYRIALDLGQNYRDIIAWNNLANPNDIKADQVLRVLPPEAAPGTAQTGSVAAASAVEIRTLPATPSASITDTPRKVAPRGDKRPYSEATLAELQKPDAIATTVAFSGPAAKPEAPRIVDVKPPEKTTHAAPPAEDENVSWMWPADGKVVASFEESKKGIDIAGKNGQQVVAAGSGKVMYAGSGIRGYGNLVIVKHTSSMLSAYAHNRAILVKEGQVVTKGQQIAEMGSSDADAVKLHFEIRQQGKPVDPSKFLPNR